MSDIRQLSRVYRHPRVVAARKAADDRFVREVLRAFKYDPERGELVDRASGCRMVRRKPDNSGYLPMFDTIYSSAKLTWIWHNQAIPPALVQRVNKVKKDDRIENLSVKFESRWAMAHGEGATNWIVRSRRVQRGRPQRRDIRIVKVCRSYAEVCAEMDRIDALLEVSDLV